MCDVEFDGQNDFTFSRRRKARKPHSCIECGKKIEPGEFYTHHSAKWDFQISTHSTCELCDKIAETHSKAEHSMGNSSAYYVGELREMVGECAREHPEYVAAFRKAWRGEQLPLLDRAEADRKRREAYLAEHSHSTVRGL